MSLLIPISAVDGGEWSASHSSHFTPAVSIPITNKLGCCVGLRNCGCFADKKKPRPYQKLNNSFTVQHCSVVIKPTILPQLLNINAMTVENVMESVLTSVYKSGAPNSKGQHNGTHRQDRNVMCICKCL